MNDRLDSTWKENVVSFIASYFLLVQISVSQFFFHWRSPKIKKIFFFLYHNQLVAVTILQAREVDGVELFCRHRWSGSVTILKEHEHNTTTCNVRTWSDENIRKRQPVIRGDWILPIIIHVLVCLATDPKPLPKQALHIVRSRASSFKWEYPLLSLRSFSNFLRLLLRLPVTFIPPFIFPWITCCRRQFLHKMWPI